MTECRLIETQLLDGRKKVTSFEEIQKQLKKTLDHVEQKNLKSSFETLSLATAGVVDNCEHLGNFFSFNLLFSYALNLIYCAQG